MPDRKPTSAFLPAAGALIVLLALYVVSYYRLVRPIEEWELVEIRPASGSALPMSTLKPWLRADYDSELYACNWFYVPMHCLDRCIIRPNYWEPESPFDDAESN